MAPFYIFLIAVVLGLGLLVWIAVRARSQTVKVSQLELSKRLTATGIATYGIFAVSMVIGVAFAVVWPQSIVGHWIRTQGLATYLLIAIMVVIAVQAILEALGIPIFKADR